MLLIFAQVSETEEWWEFLQVLLDFDNPIYYSIFLLLSLVGLTYIFYKFIYIPQQFKHNLERERLENKNARLMALFAELDPDPVVRIDNSGVVMQTNDAAKDISERTLKGMHFEKFLDIKNVDIEDIIEHNSSLVFEQSLSGKHYTVLLRGNAYLNIAQLYFRNITDRKRYEEELVISRQKLQHFSHHLQERIESERQRIARELHDGIGQSLSFIRLKIAQMMNEESDKENNAKYESLVDNLEDTIAELKEITYRLKPKVLEELGLGAALNSFVNKTSSESGINCTLHVEGSTYRLASEVETAIYRVTQEAINNSLKHARATNLSVLLKYDPAKLTLVITDNGIGFDSVKVLSSAKETKGMGVFNIHERIESYGGNVQLLTEPGGGCKYIIEIPYGGENGRK